ncbi:Bro-N domain-containing protein [Faucicola mancuniensis]|uniref:BRO-N domain-containing protein n=1 Tax=Faucicola mancuniensis TaxID=1309795 RepID=UPI003977908B
MNALTQTFTFNQSFKVRTAIKDGEAWFCLKDVASVLDIKNSRDVVAKQLDSKGVDKIYIPTESGNQQVTFINEPNLYRIIFRSNKAEAKNFQYWVFNEVLPAIRKTGQYQAKPKCEKRNYVSNADMVNIKRLIWLTTHSMRWEQSAVNAIWTRLRFATGTPSPAVFEVEHLPIIANEMLDIYKTVVRLNNTVAEAEKIIIKRILRNNEDADLIMAECEKLIMQSANEFEQNLSSSCQKVFGGDVEQLLSRQYRIGCDYPSCNEIAC